MGMSWKDLIPPHLLTKEEKVERKRYFMEGDPKAQPPVEARMRTTEDGYVIEMLEGYSYGTGWVTVMSFNTSGGKLRAVTNHITTTYAERLGLKLDTKGHLEVI